MQEAMTMTRIQRRSIGAAAVAFVVVMSGCQSYYQITDPNTDRLYYATQISVQSGSGALVLEDSLRKIDVHLDEYEVQELTAEEYEGRTRDLDR
jgi:hypothetical protein